MHILIHYGRYSKGWKGFQSEFIDLASLASHLSFKAVVDLAQSGVSRMVITDAPASVLLDACTVCVAGKTVHLPHKEGRGRCPSIWSVCMLTLRD